MAIMILNCAIIDDEPLAVDMMKSYVEKTPFLNLTGAYNSAVTAIKSLREQPVDVLFIDIQMPELSGLEFAKILPKRTKLIFTTAFSQYSLEGYDVDALAYLLKPISYEVFLKAANKALNYFIDIEKVDNCKTDRFMYLKSDYKLVRIDFDKILYIEGLKDYIRIYLDSGEKVVSLMNMKTLEDFLPKPEFMRTHRSWIVHMPKVKTVDKFRLACDDTLIPISETYKDIVMSYFESHTVS